MCLPFRFADEALIWLAAIGIKKLTEEPVVEEIAKKLGATTAQVLVAWGAHRGQSVIPKSVQEERIISNFKQVTLSEEDFEKISALGKGRHLRCVVTFASDVALTWADTTSRTATRRSGTSRSSTRRRRQRRRTR